MTDTNSAPSLASADYDNFAAANAARIDNSLFNAWYERPEMIRLAGDVAD
jgi:hypothetical protein